MNLLKRSYITVTREKWRSMVLFIIFGILTNVVIGAYSVRLSFSQTDELLRAQTPSIMAIGENSWEVFQYWSDDLNNEERLGRGRLTYELAESVSRLPYVIDYEILLSTGLNSFHLNNYGEFANEGQVRNFILQGTSRSELLRIETGLMNLTSGRQFYPEEIENENQIIPVIVSEQFALHNNLSLNSEFRLYQYFQAYHHGEIIDYLPFDFIIVGLFDIPITSETQTIDNHPDALEREDALRILHIPNIAINSMYTQREEVRVSNPEIMVDPHGGFQFIQTIYHVDPAKANEFREVVEPLLPNQFYEIHDLSGRYEAFTSAMMSMETIGNLVIILSISSSILILSLILIFFIKERAIEIGILLAIGEKKVKIFLQFIIEILMIYLPVAVFSVFTGNLISRNISRSMLYNELMTSETIEQHDILNHTLRRLSIPNPALTIDEMLEIFDVSLSYSHLFILFVLSLIVISLSLLFPLIYILKLDARQILIGDFKRTKNKMIWSRKKSFFVVSSICSAIMFLLVFRNIQSEREDFQEVDVYEYITFNEIMDDENYYVWNNVQNLINKSEGDFNHLINLILTNNVIFALRVNDEPIDNEILYSINNYGLRGEFLYATPNLRNGEVILELHFETVDYNSVIRDLLLLDNSSREDLDEWLNSSGMNKLNAMFSSVLIDDELEDWYIIFDRFHPEGFGEIRILGNRNDNTSVNLDTIGSYTLLEKEEVSSFYIVGEDLSPGRFAIASEPFRTTGAGLRISSEQFFIDEWINEGSTVTVYLFEGDRINVRGDSGLVFTPVTDRTIRTSLNRGMWTVGKDLSPGIHDFTTQSGIGRIQVIRDDEKIFDEILGTGRLWEGTTFEELSTYTEGNNQRIRFKLIEGDLIIIKNLARVEFNSPRIE